MVQEFDVVPSVTERLGTKYSDWRERTMAWRIITVLGSLQGDEEYGGAQVNAAGGSWIAMPGGYAA
jgi:hypothetical protein